MVTGIFGPLSPASLAVSAAVGVSVLGAALAADPQPAPATPGEGGKTAKDQHALIGVKATTRGTFQRTSHPDAQWFGNAGLGLFIHWGISSVHGGIDLSWGMMADKPWDPNAKPGVSLATPEEYFALAKSFKPDKYDPDKWLSAAREAGFRYAVLTTKHHDGFAMWPSDVGEFGVKQYLPGVDLVKDYIDACRKNDLKVGLYYSPPDWYFNRNYMSFHYGSGDQKRFPGRKHFGLKHEVIDAIPSKPAGFDDACRAYVRAQVQELLTRYGKIDVIWFDGGPDVIAIDEIRALQPGIIVNPRMHGYGDFTTPECHMPDGPIAGWWELCDIWPCGGWGYAKSHEKYKTTGWMLAELAKVRGWGGNLLINVGPRPTGEMPDAYYEHLREVADWMKHSGAALFGVKPGPAPAEVNVPTTIRDNTWYLLVPPTFKEPVTVCRTDVPKSVKMLRTETVVDCGPRNGLLCIEIPAAERTALVDVVEITW